MFSASHQIRVGTGGSQVEGCRTDFLDSSLMGRYRGGRKTWEQADDAGRKLDSRQFPELNAVFYTARPSEFISMRIMALSLLACDDAQTAASLQRGQGDWQRHLSCGGRPQREEASTLHPNGGDDDDHRRVSTALVTVYR